MSKLEPIGDFNLEHFRDIAEMVERNERDPRFQALERARAQAKRDEEADLDESMTDKALSGVYGVRARKVAEDFLAKNARTSGNLARLRRLLANVEGRLSG